MHLRITSSTSDIRVHIYMGFIEYVNLHISGVREKGLKRCKLLGDRHMTEVGCTTPFPPALFSGFQAGSPGVNRQLRTSDVVRSTSKNKYLGSEQVFLIVAQWVRGL